MLVKLRAAVIIGLAMVLSWIGGGVELAQAHDPNLSRWDVSASGRDVSIAIRATEAGLFSELKKKDPTADWETMTREQYRTRVEAFLAQAIDFRTGGRRLPVKIDRLKLGHEVTARARLRKRSATPLTAFTLDLTEASSSRNQHHLVFVRHGEGHDRFMLHRSNEDGLVLKWKAPQE